MKKNRAVIVSLVIIALAAVLMSGLILSEETQSVDGDELIIPPGDMLVPKGNNMNIDFGVYSASRVVVEGTYTGTIQLYAGLSSSNPVALCTVYLVGVSNVIVWGGEQPCITGSTTGTVILEGGTLRLGNEDTGFTGSVSGSDGIVTFNDVTGALLSIQTVNGHNSMVISGDIRTSNGIGFSVISSYSGEREYSASGGNSIKMQGLISNELLGNDISVSFYDNTYYLSGTLANINKSGSSSVGTLFDFIMGGKDYDHAIIIGCEKSGELKGDSIVDLDGQILIGVSSTSDTYKINGKTVNLSGLSFAKNGAPSGHSVSGISGSMTMSDSVVLGSVKFGSDVAVSINGSASAVKNAVIEIDGSLNVTGSFDATNVSSMITGSNGVITSSGTMKTLESLDISKTDIHSVYYTTDESGKTVRCYTNLSKAVTSASDSKIFVIGSYTVRSDTMIPTGLTLENLGSLFLDGKSTLTINGTFVNSGGFVISENAYTDTFRGTLTNKGYIISFGMIKIKGSEATAIYADVSHYNNTWTVYSSLKNILEKSSPGDTFILRQDTAVRENMTIPENVTLNLLKRLTIADGITLTVKGSISFETNMDVGEGKLSVAPGGTATVTAETTFKDLDIGGTLIMKDKGKVNVTGSATVGVPPSSLPHSNSAKITGKLTISDTAYVLVYGTPTEFTASNIEGSMKHTVMYSGKDVYATEYSVKEGVGIYLPSPTLNGLGFIGWYDNSDLDGGPITAGDKVTVGQFGSIYAYTSDTVYTVTLSYNQGAVWIWNGNQTIPESGNVKTVYGPHSINVNLKDGYTGTPVIYVDGTAVDNGSNILIDKDTVITVSGISAVEPETDFGVTNVLLAVLVVIVVILAAVMLYRMRKS